MSKNKESQQQIQKEKLPSELIEEYGSAINGIIIPNKSKRMPQSYFSSYFSILKTLDHLAKKNNWKV